MHIRYAYNGRVAPAIFHIGNTRIVIYPHDHQPPHVHVIGPGAEAKFDLETFRCLMNRGFDRATVSRFRKFLKERQETLLEAWHEYQK